MSVRSTLTLLLLVAPLCAADVQTLSGKKLTGDIVGLDKQTLILKTPGGEVRQPVSDVLLIGIGSSDQSPAGPYTDLELTDGTVLHCSKVSFQAHTIDVTVTPETPLSVPYRVVSTLCKDAHDPKIKAEFHQFLAKRGRFDMIAIRSDGKLNGLEGTLGAGASGGEAIEFTVAGTEQKVTPKLDKIAGLVFVTRPDPAALPALCKVVDSGHNTLVAADVLWNDKGINLTTVSGVKLNYPDAQRLARLDFSQGKLTYLSDLDPVRAEVDLAIEDNPNFGLFVRYRRDKNLDNGPLRIDGASFTKGLALHAGSVLIFDLGGEYSTLRAVLGVDESVQTESQVEVVIEGNGRELYRGTISRRDPAKPLSLDVKGVQQLRIDVHSKSLVQLGGEVNLADAKVSK